MYNKRSMRSRMKKLRATAGLSLAQLSKVSGITKPHLWEMESGNSTNPSIDILGKLVKVYGVSIGYLIGEVEK